jgi:hypothetical protein
MNPKTSARFVTVPVFLLVVILIIVLFKLPRDFFSPSQKVYRQTQLVIPQTPRSNEDRDYSAAQSIDDNLSSRVPLENGEIIVSALTDNFDTDAAIEQLVLYRNFLEEDNPLYLTYIEFDETTREYLRVWSAPTAASRPGTVSFYTQDLLGDRSVCAVVTGMNSQGEHTLTVFRKMPESVTNDAPPAPFVKIAELRIDGAISIDEVPRTQAYQTGASSGAAFTITTHGHDPASPNELDQIVASYAYSPLAGSYVETAITQVPGAQVEESRLREILNGGKETFETFIGGLWYHVGPQGTLDDQQYIYFDSENQEIIFYGDTQQVFTWLSSNPTRYGLYVSTQNISVATLRRFVDIELESPESIRIKVFEDVRMKIGLTAPWDGTYRKKPDKKTDSGNTVAQISYISAEYDSTRGKIVFHDDGNYEIISGAGAQAGRYVFFHIDGMELLEFISGQPVTAVSSTVVEKETFIVERPETTADAGTITLRRIRLGTKGVQDYRETAITLQETERAGG